jgi:3-deoxy-D-arabino-heptulosonate 7-phosphate (DAHP) synthase
MVEVHPHPDKSVSDAKQTISPQSFADMMNVINRIQGALKV